MPANLPSISESVRRCLSTHAEIQAGYVFGSMVSGRTHPDSDVDVAVLVNPKFSRAKSLRNRLSSIAEIASALGRSDVDLIILNSAPPVLAHQVLSKGRLVLQRSAAARVAFQVRAVNAFLDTEPMRALFRTYLKKR